MQGRNTLDATSNGSREEKRRRVSGKMQPKMESSSINEFTEKIFPDDEEKRKTLETRMMHGSSLTQQNLVSYFENKDNYQNKESLRKLTTDALMCIGKLQGKYFRTNLKKDAMVNIVLSGIGNFEMQWGCNEMLRLLQCMECEEFSRNLQHLNDGKSREEIDTDCGGDAASKIQHHRYFPFAKKFLDKSFKPQNPYKDNYLFQFEQRNSKTKQMEVINVDLKQDLILEEHNEHFTRQMAQNELNKVDPSETKFCDLLKLEDFERVHEMHDAAKLEQMLEFLHKLQGKFEKAVKKHEEVMKNSTVSGQNIPRVEFFFVGMRPNRNNSKALQDLIAAYMLQGEAFRLLVAKQPTTVLKNNDNGFSIGTTTTRTPSSATVGSNENQFFHDFIESSANASKSLNMAIITSNDKSVEAQKRGNSINQGMLHLRQEELKLRKTEVELMQQKVQVYCSTQRAQTMQAEIDRLEARLARYEASMDKASAVNNTSAISRLMHKIEQIEKTIDAKVAEKENMLCSSIG